MAQFQAGYILEEVMPALQEAVAGGVQAGSAEVAVRALLRELSSFELSGLPLALSPPLVPPPALLAVAVNLLSRGLPTRLPLPTTRLLLGALWPGAKLDPTQVRRGSLRYESGKVSPDFGRLLWQALHLVDPRLRDEPTTRTVVSAWLKLKQPVSFDAHGKAVVSPSSKLGSDAERRLLLEVLPAFDKETGPLLWQLLELQAALPELLKSSTNDDAALLSAQSFAEQNVDFALTLPYGEEGTETSRRGLVLEVDGSQHKEPAQKLKDNSRDAAARQAHWQPVRLPTDQFAAPQAALEPLRHLLGEHPYLQRLRENYTNSLLTTPDGRRALQVMLTPLAVARVQRALLTCMQNGLLGWEKNAWRIAVLERDVPCAHLAVDGLRELLTNLFELEGAGRRLPEIDLQVWGTVEFAKAELRQLPGHEVQELVETQPPTGPAFDVLLDVSVWQRPGFSAAPTTWPAAAHLTLRSAHRAHSARQFQTAPLILYPALVQTDNRRDEYEYPVADGAAPRIAALRRLLRDVFRKTDFRPGQLPILSRALRGESVLGLLPTGGGKSLTYQLAALLQPGVTLVVDPIKSLMQDQYEGLLSNWIDGVSYINSSVAGGRAGKERRVEQLEGGELLMVFVSPERFIIQEFRDALKRMGGHVGFAYCVIDEAHCVSEWGHDFRTHYLHLGRNARTFCRTLDNQPVPLYALTATASFDVLADVERELELTDPAAVIRSKTNRRLELGYRVVPVAEAARQSAVGPAKENALKKLLGRLPAELAKFDQDRRELTGDEKAPNGSRLTFDAAQFYEPDNNKQFRQAGLIFCPHRERKFSGVLPVLRLVRTMDEFSGNQAGYFMAPDAGLTQEQQAAQNQALAETQSAFVGNRLNLLVATKAFGMGIDKPDVRFTIHYAHPSSIESFIQETGRAGRDRNSALNYVLFHPDDQTIQQEFHRSSFKGQQKDTAVVHELLTEITYPANQANGEILDLLLAETGVAASDLKVGKPAAIAPSVLPIYLAHSFEKSLGRIYFQAGKGFWPDLSTIHHSLFAEGEKALTWLVAYFKRSVPPEAQTSLEALMRHFSPPPVPGIQKRLQAIQPGEQPEPLLVGFSNDALERMHEILNRYGKKLPEHAQNLATACQFANTGEDGRQGGENFVRDMGIRPDSDCGRELAAQWLRYRGEQETMKAIHRLSLLGVVEDYTTDYSASLITVQLAPKPASDQEYLGHLSAYLRRYTTIIKAQQLCDTVANRPKGATMLEKCLGTMLDFTYDTIVAKRLLSISQMHDALQKYGVETVERMSLAEYCDLYLNSKYAEKQHLPTEEENKLLDTADTLWKYLHYLANPPDGQGKEVDNVKHLRGACARLLPQAGYQNSPALLVLDGFCILFLENHKPRGVPADARQRAEGQAKLLNGLLGFGQLPEYADPVALRELAAHLADAVDVYDKAAARYLRDEVLDMLELHLHLGWLRTFNTRFDDRNTAVFAT